MSSDQKLFYSLPAKSTPDDTPDMGTLEVEARYRDAHRDEINARKRLWYAQNKERINAGRRARYPNERHTVLSRQSIRCTCPHCERDLCKAYLGRHVARVHLFDQAVRHANHLITHDRQQTTSSSTLI